MRRTLIAFALSLFGAGFLASGLVVGAASQSQDGERGTPTMAEMLAQGAPGPEHELLAGMAGEWDQVMTMTFPGAPPMTAKATGKCELVLGGRFLRASWTSTLMGTPIEGLNMLGFDRRKGVYTSTAFDSGGTYSVYAEGPRDAETGVISMEGVDESPWGRESWRMDLDVKGPDEFIVSAHYHEQGGKTFDPPLEMVKVVSRRKKP